MSGFDFFPVADFKNINNNYKINDNKNINNKIIFLKFNYILINKKSVNNY